MKNSPRYETVLSQKIFLKKSAIQVVEFEPLQLALVSFMLQLDGILFI